MELTVLVDNNSLVDHYFDAEPGLSFYIEEEGKRILFDLGYSDAFARNANRMGIGLDRIDHIVFSHGHIDHTGGLFHFANLLAEARLEGKDFKAPELLCHPLALRTKLDDGFSFIGSPVSMDVIRSVFPCNFVKEPYFITRDLVFLGEVERSNGFEAKGTFGKTLVDGKGAADRLLDDSALAYRSEEGLVIITGCSHSGICNIISYAKKVLGEDRVRDVIGGLHLIRPSAELMERTKGFFKDNRIEQAHPCHCTDLGSKIALSEVCEVSEVGVGQSYVF
ncbi:MAG: MBL fold metallo-hydrolase [Candidatus Methanofastidiosa archaeon]|nr:MBL fold metallo-hydrolase [Candidatus Methanofastidiosa archaeon]